MTQSSQEVGKMLSSIMDGGRRKHKDQFRMRVRQESTFIGLDMWMAQGQYKTMEDGIRALLQNSGIILSQPKKVF